MTKKVDEMIMSEIVEQINQLAAIKKTRTLTEEESLFREELKKAYIKNFRSGLEQQLLNTKIINGQGEDITPKKLKEVKNEK